MSFFRKQSFYSNRLFSIRIEMERFLLFEQDSVYSNNLPQRDFKLEKIYYIRIGFWSIRITYLSVISKLGKMSSIRIGFLYIQITHFSVIFSLILFE
ncbi:hypothetical protein GIB67_028232 [Kingdonia uniflora]|uniref:Uncharacterized protein n=1 Tax=Kingdonia uniflora TaxID=39325 RepID=A0A7J7KZ57_9MAGN|nr:hypothetical protein GIB67_028232 [Kingdonia uniflora]